MYGVADAFFAGGSGTSPSSSLHALQQLIRPKTTQPPQSGLFQSCLQLGERLARVPGFERDFPLRSKSKRRDSSSSTGSSSEPHDPVSQLWQYFRQGKPLCVLFNVYATYAHIAPISYRVESKLSNANACKALVMRFILALKERLGWDPEDTFTVSQLYLSDTNGFVRVVRTLDRFLLLLEDCGLLHPTTPVPSEELPPQPPVACPRDQRELVGMELLESERKYVHDLEILQSYASAISQYDIVSQDTIYHIFGNLDQLVDAQRRFLICLEQNAQKPLESQQLGYIFQSLEDDFSVYDLFCANYANALQYINDERAALSQLSQIPAAQSRYLEPSYELPTFLIKPVQRICKYPLLLEQLLKHTPEGAPGHADVVEALATIRRITDKVNETRRSQENEQVVKNLEARVEDWKGHSLRTFGSLLLSDTFVVSKGDSEREFGVYLFEHILLCCKDTSTSAPYQLSLTPGRSRSKSGSRLRQRGGSMSESSASRREQQKPGPLQLKGRIFLSNIVAIQVLGRRASSSSLSAMPTESIGPYTLQVWWHGELELESFCLRCKNEEQLRMWYSTMQKLLGELRARRQASASQASTPVTTQAPSLPGSRPGSGHSKGPASAAFMQVSTPVVSYAQDTMPMRLRRSNTAECNDALLGRSAHTSSNPSLKTSFNTPSVSDCDSPRDTPCDEATPFGLPHGLLASPVVPGRPPPPPAHNLVGSGASGTNHPCSSTAPGAGVGAGPGPSIGPGIGSGLASASSPAMYPPRMPWRQRSLGNIHQHPFMTSSSTTPIPTPGAAPSSASTAAPAPAHASATATPPAVPVKTPNRVPIPVRSSSVSGNMPPLPASAEFLDKEMEAMKLSKALKPLRGFAAARGGPSPMRLDSTIMQRTSSDSAAIRSFMSPTLGATPTTMPMPSAPLSVGQTVPPNSDWALTYGHVSPTTEWNPYFPMMTSGTTHAPPPSATLPASAVAPGPMGAAGTSATSAVSIAAPSGIATKRQDSFSTTGSRVSADASQANTPSVSHSPMTRQNSSSGASGTGGSSVWMRSAPHSPPITMQVRVCVRYGPERVELQVPNTVSFSNLHALVHSSVRVAPEALTRMYHIDEDGDRVMLLDDDDLATAMEHVRRVQSEPHLVVVLE